MDLLCPKKLVSRDGVDRDRNKEEHEFDSGDLGRAIAKEQKKHPGQKHHGVAIRKLPAAGISVDPEREREETDCKPNRHSLDSAFAKDQNQKRTGQENRTTKRSEADPGKIRRVSKAFEQHFVNVPGNGMKREEAVLVPRFFHDVRDMGITEIKQRMEAREIVESGAKPEANGNGKKVGQSPPSAPRLERETFQIFRFRSELLYQKINKDRQAKNYLSAIADRQRKESSGDDRPGIDEHKIQSRDFAEK